MKTRTQEIENMRQIVEAIVTDALAKGAFLRIYSEGEYDGKADTVDEAMNLVMLSDDNRIEFYRGQYGPCIGVVYLVYDNAAWKVICDHDLHDFTLGVIARAEALAESFEEQHEKELHPLRSS